MGKIGVWVLGIFLILWGASMLLAPTLAIPAWALGVAGLIAGIAILTGR